MLVANFLEDFARGADAPGPHILQTLPNALGCAGIRREVEKTLIGFRILHDRRGFSVHGKYDRALSNLKMAQYFC